MDYGKKFATFRSPILFTMVLLIIIPSSSGYIDCRISCRRCHENTEHPAVLEVYCAMCEECKQRRRERMLGRTKGKIKSTKNPLVRMRDGVEVSTDDEALILRPQEALQYQQAEQDSQLQYQGQPQQQYEAQQQFEQQPLFPPPQQPPQEPSELQQAQLGYTTKKSLRGMMFPPGCPTPPICSDTEDEDPVTRVPLTQPPTTTTTQMPCPPIPSCVKKKKHHPDNPCMNPCMVPAPMCPCPIYPPPGPGTMFPPGCPTSPVCSDTEDEDPVTRVPLTQPPTTTTTTTTTTTQMPCPPIPSCVKKKKHYSDNPCMNPCMIPAPMCPCPIFPPPGPGMYPPVNPQWPVSFPPQPPITPDPKQPLTQPVFPTQNQPSSVNEDYYYVFIGLPKNAV